MFELDERRTHAEVAPQQIVALYHSVNQTSVLVPGESSASARAVVIGSRAGADFDVAVVLHLVDSGRHLLYAPPGAGALSSEEAREQARAALDFVESMGFFMENVNWRGLSEAERGAVVERLAVFSPPKEKSSQERRPVDPRLTLARLLAQF